MSYKDAVDIIKGVCETENPNGLFEHCRKWDASLEFSGPDCQIYLYPITSNVDVKNNFYETFNCLLGLYFQDAPDSTNEERELLIASAGNLAKKIIVALNDTESIEIAGVRMEPSYRQMSGTYTGYLVSFTLSMTANICATDEYQLNTNNVILTNTDGTYLKNT